MQKRERPKARIVTPIMALAIVYSKVLLEHKLREDRKRMNDLTTGTRRAYNVREVSAHGH